MKTASSPTLADLWREARAWLAAALADFRGPAAIAQTRARETIRAIRRRLALIECLVMKLLLIEAALSSPARGGGRELPRKREEREGDVRRDPRTRRSVSRCALDSSPQSGEHVHRGEDAANPETWRVCFHARIPRERTRTRSGVRLALTPRADATQFHARALARRFEALRRVLSNPRRAIAALARKLAALGAAARAAARRIALARGPRGESPGPVFAIAMVASCDASFAFPRDTS